ncbi:MAG: hypothetical protein RL153_1912 [Verrucomicrobiota bacterium]|jgi:hypothetical protein
MSKERDAEDSLLDERTFSLLDRYLDGRVAEFRALITGRLTSESGRPYAARRRLMKVKADEELRRAASAFLSYVQFLSLRVAAYNVNERILFHGINTSIVTTFELLMPFVESERLRTKRDDFYAEGEALVEAWRKPRPYNWNHDQYLGSKFRTTFIIDPN